MGIDISNTTFKMFTDFAATVSGRTRLAVDDVISQDKPLHSVKASTNWDFIGNIGRSAAKKQANNEVRNLFYNAVVELFGGESHIPDNVKAAMKLDNFGKGKPLTARRIIAVQNAIADVKAPSSYLDYAKTVAVAANKLKENAFSHSTITNGNYGDEAVNKAVDTVIAAAGNDLDLMNVLKEKSVLSSVLVSNNKLRSNDSIKSKVAAIRANVNELREATGGDKSLFYMGLRGLIVMGGKPLNAGVIKSIVDQVKLAGISDLKKLSGSSNVMQLHKGIAQYVKNVETIKLSSRALESFKDGVGGEEMAAVNRFIGRLLISRCSESAQNSILASFNTDACGKLQGAYARLSYGDQIDGVTNTVWNEMMNQSGLCTNAITDIAYIVSPEDVRPQIADPAVGNNMIPEGSKLFGKIAQDVLDRAEASLETKTKAIIGDYVSGNGQGADIIRFAFDEAIRKIGVNNNAEQTIKGEMNNIVKNGLHYNIMTNAKDFFAAEKLEDTLFAKDLQRIAKNTTIGGEKLDTSDVHKAADQIAKFVTGGARKFAELDGKEKMKAFVVMSMITQNTIQTMSRSMLSALDPNKNQMPFSLNDDGAEIEPKSYLALDISFDDKGGLKVDAKCVNYIHSVHEGTVADPSREDIERPTDNRTITSGFTLEMPKTAFDRYADLGESKTYSNYVNGQKVEEKIDISKLDVSKAKNIERDDEIKNKSEEMVKSFGKYFQMPKDIKCNTSYKVNLV